MKSKSKMILLVGKCAVGKTTFETAIRYDKNISVNNIMSLTTRKMRANEKQGVDYHFVSNEEFDKIITEQKPYEQTSYMVNGELYRYALVPSAISDDLVNVAVVNPHGLKQLMNTDLKDRIIVIHITSTMQERIQRYLSREDLTDTNVYKRLVERIIQDEKDFGALDDYVEKLCKENGIEYINYVNSNVLNVEDAINNFKSLFCQFL